MVTEQMFEDFNGPSPKTHTITDEYARLMISNARLEALVKVQCLLAELLMAKISGKDTLESMEDTVKYLNTRIKEMVSEYKA